MLSLSISPVSSSVQFDLFRPSTWLSGTETSNDGRIWLVALDVQQSFVDNNVFWAWSKYLFGDFVAREWTWILDYFETVKLHMFLFFFILDYFETVELHRGFMMCPGLEMLKELMS